MTPLVITVEHLSKQYDLGVVGTGTLSRDLERWWARARGKPDPYAIIGHEQRPSKKGESILALDDVSFTVRQGEALGIIGRNGAGKSTLLKILSRITAPASGSVKIKGRVGSLLEIGTGFHPELTGRENVYLNGAILGMKKEEVARKFDEIIDFSGVEKYIDTPVKRYSSGMYVRLAFAVAAHLDPEILIVDEVLAVGDAEFQRKCLRKMGDVSEEGRTVLFVSHNLSAVQRLCGRCILFSNGKIIADSVTREVTSLYFSIDNPSTFHKEWLNPLEAPGNDVIKLHSISLLNDNNEIVDLLETENSFNIAISFTIFDKFPAKIFGLSLFSDQGIEIFNTHNDDIVVVPNGWTPGNYTFYCKIPGNFLNDGNYYIRLSAVKGAEVCLTEDRLLNFSLNPEGKIDRVRNRGGLLRPLLNWTYKKG